ncbi:MAG: hypothetical protein QOD26_1460 [Betaproteobacteria bacterium]|jgi:predicted acylesterase/phospholipase RssA|nr:hypothetical protein [Betaproteobacteria bacterium]
MPKALLACITCVLVCGCNSLAHFNSALDVAARSDQHDGRPVYRPPTPSTPGLVRATLQVDGYRGNPKVLFFLALSGGGSRAAYFSASTMLKLQTVFSDIDLLGEVDVISSVSGGSLPAAYYAASRDRNLTVPGVLRQSVPTIGEEVVRSPERLRLWNDGTVRELMKRDYLLRSTLNWFWPTNLAAYWLTSYDRSDIMAKTLEDNLYDTPILGEALTFADLNPRRPYLILNATNATGQAMKDPIPDVFSFGSVFTFTQDDFAERLNSDIRAFPIARAVQASAAFPAIYANVTLRDFRPNPVPECEQGYAHRNDDLCDPRYLHVFDGGNSDNLGLRSIKRALFELKVTEQLEEYDKVIVLLVDAFTRPKGAGRTDFDPRSAFGRLLDPNFSDAVDSLLQANRASLVGEFREGVLGWRNECGRASVRHLPPRLCDQLSQLLRGPLDLQKELVFYHFSFEAAPADLKPKLDAIATSFSIADQEADDIDSVVNYVLTERNPCLVQLRLTLLNDPSVTGSSAQSACSGESVPKTRLTGDDDQTPGAISAPVEEKK